LKTIWFVSKELITVFPRSDPYSFYSLLHTILDAASLYNPVLKKNSYQSAKPLFSYSYRFCYHSEHYWNSFNLSSLWLAPHAWVRVTLCLLDGLLMCA